MKGWVTRSGIRVTVAVQGRCNCYLVQAQGQPLLLDTGMAKSWPQLTTSLTQAGIKPGSPLLVVLTHTHFDHAENAARLAAAYATTFFVQQAEADFLSSGKSPLPAGTVLLTRALLKLFGRRHQQRARYAPVTADVLVDARYTLEPHGLPATLLHTPGHSAGSMSLVIDQELALVGDTLVGMLPGRVFPPFADDLPKLFASWQLLMDSGCQLFLPAHGRPRSRAQLERELARHRPLH